MYEARSLVLLERQLKTAVVNWLISFGLVLTFAFLLKATSDLSRGASVIMGLTGLVVVTGNRFVWRAGLLRALARGTLRPRRAAVLSTGSGLDSSSQIRSLTYAGIDVVERITLPLNGAGQQQALSHFLALSRRREIDEIVIVLSLDDLPNLDPLVETLRALPLPIRLLPDVHMSRLALQPSRQAGQYALIDIVREPLTPEELGLKRALDVVVAGAALLVAAPLLILAMAAIRLDSPGPVLFRQSRNGFNGRTFKILKLRTMSVLEDGETISQATRTDPRVTRVGAWLRRTSIDELPQLWNVLRGEMSVVGPRPHAVAHDNFYDTVIEKYAFRHHVKPGLTGWAQVNGLRGETPEIGMMAARVDHDVWYINNWSFLLDIRILVLTATRLFARTAY